MGNEQLDEILKVAVKINASDIHIKPGKPPVYRLDDKLITLKNAVVLNMKDVSDMILGIMNQSQRDQFQKSPDIDFAYGVPGVGRFRVNAYMQRGNIAAVMRAIPFNIKGIRELTLPAVIEKIAGEKRGLILVTGTTGSGKSTTLASIIEYINNTFNCNIITIEDPIEFLFRDNKSIIAQREVGFDTLNYSKALRAAMRQDPDVILVGEMRDVESIEIALTAAETGHLVLSTLHTLDATETINRIIGVFPPHQQQQIRFQLAATLKAVISQRLVPRSDGKGRVPAVEILIATARVKEYVEDQEKTKLIREAIAEGKTVYGMQTFDQSLHDLLKQGLVTYDEAMKHASNPSDFALKVSGIDTSSDKTTWEHKTAEGQEQPKPEDAKIDRF